jgi:hypothetical protein
MKEIIEKLSQKYDNVILKDGNGINRLESYNGKDSFYNSNFYKLPDGTVIKEVFDEFYEMGDMFLYRFDGKEFDGAYDAYVGYTDMNNTMFFTDVVMT